MDVTMENQPLSEQIRKAIKGSGLSRYRIAKEIGVSQSTVSRFCAGRNGISLELIDRLGTLLGMSITTKNLPN
jgi:transcriptional regulator with XRE-family HTH domain